MCCWKFHTEGGLETAVFALPSTLAGNAGSAPGLVAVGCGVPEPTFQRNEYIPDTMTERPADAKEVLALAERALGEATLIREKP